MKRDYLSKFNRYFPIAGMLLDAPELVIPLFLAVAMMLLVFSKLASMSVIVLMVLYVLVKLDGRLAKILILSPLVALLGRDCLGKSIGVCMMLVGDLTPLEKEGLLLSQLGLILFIVFFLFAYRLIYKPPPSLPFPIENKEFRDNVLIPLKWFGLFCFFYAVLGVYWGVMSGSLDRGYMSEEIYYQGAGADAIFRAFRRYPFMGFILLPLTWNLSNGLWRIIIVVAFGFHELLALITGGRGLFLFPIVLIVVGYYIFGNRPKVNYEKIMLMSFPLVVLFAYIVDVYRSSDNFKDVKVNDISSRLDALWEVDEAMSEGGGVFESAMTKIGGRFYGQFDNNIYSMTPELYPYAGFDNFESLLWVWVPYTLYQNRPTTAESVQIVHMYRGTEGSRTHISYTLPADLYRRFSWWGIPIGGVFFGLLFGAFTRFMLRKYLYGNALLGILLLILMMTLFQRSTFASVTETSADWLYDMLKHIIPILVFCLIIRRPLRGALSYRSVMSIDKY